MNVLIVEDEVRIARFLTKGLRARGFAVDHVETGAAALEKVTPDGPFDAVLLDLGLPDVDGLDVLTLLRERGVTAPVIVLTAREMDREEVLERGADEFLVKPIPSDAVIERLRSHL